uniref:Uncharacterized protein n=1 Tax=Acrobeloides nanus TaxID=290746 RepID=A0A914CXT9_9BILA
MISFSFLLVSFICLISKGATWDGVEIINPTTIKQFECLANNNVNYVFLRVGKADGSIDNVGLQNIKNAYQGGGKSSQFEIIPFFAANGNIDPTKQVEAIYAAINGLNLDINFNQVFFDITSTIWSNDQAKNQQFLEAIDTELWRVSYLPGYYASSSQWNKAFGDQFEFKQNVDPGADLMWVEITGFKNSTGFQGFGGWKTPEYHLWKLNDNLCGTNNLGLIWVDPTSWKLKKARFARVKKFKRV